MAAERIGERSGDDDGLRASVRENAGRAQRGAVGSTGTYAAPARSVP